eukprot:2197335-Rhodomonas_salina.2
MVDDLLEVALRRRGERVEVREVACAARIVLVLLPERGLRLKGLLQVLQNVLWQCIVDHRQDRVSGSGKPKVSAVRRKDESASATSLHPSLLCPGAPPGP